jgi:hypothetical protein
MSAMSGCRVLQCLLVLALLDASIAELQSTAAENDAGDDRVSDAKSVDFDRDVKPILSTRCLQCHGEKKQEAGLRLDRRADALRGGESGEPALVVGKSAESHLIKLVSGAEPDRLMPADGEKLAIEQISTLRAWIDQGALWSKSQSPEEPDDEKPSTDFWSFQTLSTPIPPAQESHWVGNSIDAFILAALDKAALEPSARAERTTLIRRLYLDLLGLPPTPSEVAEFAADARPDAYEQLVDRLLGSPHFGERWARHWLDVVRYAETSGFETNVDRPNAWQYRDYVVESFNDDKPFNTFVIEQLAGDAFGVDSATSFLVGGPYDTVKSPDVGLTLMQRQDELADMINTTGTAFLGLTLGCAKCHNHKFDPIPQKDYYAIQAVFAGVQHGERPLRGVNNIERLRAAEAVARRIEKIEAELSHLGVRKAVDFRENVEPFDAVPARFVRLTIFATNNNAEPCLDELEIYSTSDAAEPARNVARSSEGAIVTASSSLAGFAIHQLKHVNDGQYGNDHSWISNEPGRGSIQIELPAETLIDRVVWGRDRTGALKDRLPVAYAVEVSMDGNVWKTVADSNSRIPFGYGTSARIENGFAAFDRTTVARIEKLLNERNPLIFRRKELTEGAPRVYAGTFGQPGPTNRLFRGDPLSPREVVAPDALSVLGTLKLSGDTPEQERRIALAKWIADDNNPLTARVIANRVWQFHFGAGIVDTPSDFGKNGAHPTHPELLDWLARELIRSNWSLKHLHRLILNSATYRQSSTPDAAKLAVDAGSRLLWRFPPRRLEAEAIRDSILSVSGMLEDRMGGPGFSLFEPNTNYVRVYEPKENFGRDEFRRMIYSTKVRMEQDGVFGTFDCPDAGQATPKRTRSTTAIQALNLFNSPFIVQQSELLASRLRKAGSDTRIQIQSAFEIVFGRTPQEVESIEGGKLVSAHGLPAVCRALFNSNEFLFVP